jgi:transcriptional regulator with XRE-family HTH domain
VNQPSKSNTEEYMIWLGSEIAYHRERQSVSQAELARRTGMARPNISRIENGRTPVNLHTLRRIAAALNTDLIIAFRPRSEA